VDILKFAVEETSVLELRGADDAPLRGDDGAPMTVTVYGPGSKPYARAQAARQNRMVDRLKRKGKADQSAEEKAREQAEFLAGCTKEFSANIEYGGLSGEALHKAVYADARIGFIAEQVGAHLSEWGNFSKGSPKP
jgi:hypothetical protein